MSARKRASQKFSRNREEVDVRRSLPQEHVPPGDEPRWIGEGCGVQMGQNPVVMELRNQLWSCIIRFMEPHNSDYEAP